MKKEEFIQKIAGYVKKYAAAYEIKVCSPILYGLGNNYIYNVNKDKIKGKYMENRNNMNIKVLWSSFFVTLRPNFHYRSYTLP